MKHLLSILAVLFILTATTAQSPNCYRIYLHDKAGSPYSIERPDDFLSQRAIDKRTRFGISITEEDLPINPEYKNSLRAIDNSIVILSNSKWTNTVTVWCPDSTKVSEIQSLSFVDSIKSVGYFARLEREVAEPQWASTEEFNAPDTASYGKGFGQIALHNGQKLHQKGYRGEGMLIAMLDAGWTLFDKYEGFAPLYENGQIIGTYNLVPGLSDVYRGHSHGTSCASIILSSIFGDNDTLVGTAPNANMVFIRTEDPSYEQLIEEDFLAAGLEIADSLGADVISASLGYTTFDDTTYNTGYSSCDGRTSIASQAATKAAHKGMIVCVAAGNEGGNEWHRISRPSDAEDILCVGAVNIDSVTAPFSGCGPSYDGRVKPDAASCGWDTYVTQVVRYEEETYNIYITAGNGTSYATPCLAGLCACLWQALPQYNSLEMMQIIRESGHQFQHPDTLQGYGIPDFYAAYESHFIPEKVAELLDHSNIQLFPNPSDGKICIVNESSEKAEIDIYDINGKRIRKVTLGGTERTEISTSRWAKGTYVVRIKSGEGWNEAKKIIVK